MKIKIWSKLLFCSLLLAVFVGFVFLADYQNNKAIEINYQTQVVKTEKLNYASLSEMFEDLSASTTEDGTKIVTSTLKLKGDSLNNITYTSNEAEQNLVISSVTQTSVDGTSTAHLNFDFGDFEENIFATSNIQFVNGEITGTVTFDGQEYDAKEVLAEYLGEDGINECFWWCFIKVIVIVIQVIIVAQTAYDLYQYLTMEEVTIEGVLSIICEGLVMSAVGGLAGVVAKYAVKTGKSLFKAGKTKSNAKTENGKILTGLKGDISFDACIDTVKSGKRHIDISAESHYCNKKDYANDKSSIEAYYLTQYKKAGYSFRGGNGDKDLTIHHIVEQSQAPKKFANADIQTDLNTVAISPKLHQLISDFYNTGPSKNADLLNKLFPGKFDLKAGGKLRNQIYNMSYEDQYEVGTRILEHFLSQATVDKEKTCLRVSKIK